MGIIKTGKCEHSKSIVTSEGFIEFLKRNGKWNDVAAPETLIICFQPEAQKALTKKYDSPKIKGMRFSTILEEEKLGVCTFRMGAPAAACAMDEFAAWGVKKFIVVGIAGSIVQEINPGEIILCDRAFRDEGTSHHYLDSSEDIHASEGLCNLLENKLGEKGYRFKRGAAWTTDAPYRETMEDVKYFSSRGALVVEMELAALFAVAKYKKVEIAAVVTVSDSLAGGKWQPEFFNKKVMDTLGETAVVASEL